MVENAFWRKSLAAAKSESPILPVDLQQYLMLPEVQLPPATGVLEEGGAWVLDAGGLLDAGLLDAGLLDAGLLDAGLLDAGLLDTGVTAAVTLPAKAMTVTNEMRDL